MGSEWNTMENQDNNNTCMAALQNQELEALSENFHPEDNWDLQQQANNYDVVTNIVMDVFKKL